MAIYIRCREIGSLDSLLWLARSVRGKSQHVRMARGPDRESIMNRLSENVKP